MTKSRTASSRNYYFCLFVFFALVTGPVFLVLLLNQRCYPPLRFPVSGWSTFHNMSDVQSKAVLCTESIENFPAMASKFFLKTLVTILVVLIITSIILHIRFHICFISVHNLQYSSFLSATFCKTLLSADIATPIGLHVFCFLFLIITSSKFTVISLPVCTA